MSDALTYDAFLADPAGCWRRYGDAPLDWAIQAARSSRQFRDALADEIVKSVSEHGSLEFALPAAGALKRVYDAQDVAELFARLSKERPPADWAAEFARTFSG